MGLIVNLKYWMVLDFLCGWFGEDLAGDDENPMGKWPWQDAYTGNMPERVKLDY